jgi:oxygen-independent coproporphyrinogen-3 oxidase
LIDDYLKTLYLDIDNIFNIIKALGLQVATIYIGGGTPTVLSAKQLDTLMKRISSHIDVSTLMEYTIEAGRPDTITEEKLRVIKGNGANRISVNTQTLNDEVLSSIGRKHTVADFYRAYDLAKSFDIGSINVDLIAGLPNDTFDSFSNSIDNIISLQPENITVHTFSVKNSADLKKKESDIYSSSEETALKCVEYSQIKTKFASYKPYYVYRQKNTVGNLENVGYSLDGKEGMYNIFMMEELHSVFAVGAGAVTKLVDYRLPLEGKTEIKRIFTPKYPYEYLRDAEKIRLGDKENGIPSLFEKISGFYLKG